MNYAWLKARRWVLRHRSFQPPFDALLTSEMPNTATTIDELEVVSLDIETTSLEAASADMLSVGWVIIREGRVDLSTARSFIVRPSGDVGDSASVHGLTDTIVREGLDWRAVLDQIVQVLTGRVLLVHHAGLDKALLDRLCERRFGAKLPVPVVDTLALEARRRQRQHHTESNEPLRLPDLRRAYGLPRYAAHDCLIDAIATAELLLAIAAHRRLSSLGDLTV